MEGKYVASVMADPGSLLILLRRES